MAKNCLVSKLKDTINVIGLEKIGCFMLHFTSAVDHKFFAVGKVNGTSCLVTVEGENAYFGDTEDAQSGVTSFEAVAWSIGGALSGKYLKSTGECYVHIHNCKNATRINTNANNFVFDGETFHKNKSLQAVVVNQSLAIDMVEMPALGRIVLPSGSAVNIRLKCSSIHERTTMGYYQPFETITDVINMLKSLPSTFTSVVLGGSGDNNILPLKTANSDVVAYADLDADSKAKVLTLLQYRYGTSSAHLGKIQLLGHEYTYDGTHLLCDGEIVN